jgi:hypothetical protein
MNKLDKQYQWVSWETSTHYCICEWNGGSDKITAKWVRKNE